MSKLHFTAHLYYLDEDYRIFTYYDTNKDKIYKHMHDFYEIYRLISGHVKYSTAGNSFYLTPGDFLFINRHQEHFPEVLDFSEPYERMALHVSPDTLKELSCGGIDLTAIFSQNEFKVYHYPIAIEKQINSYYNQLNRLYDGPDIYGRKVLGRSLLASLFVLLTQHMDTPSVYSFDKSNKNIQIISVTEQYIRNHLDEKILIGDLAEYLFMNPYYFMHQFKELSGLSVYQFIQKVRIDALKEHVEQGESLMEAAQSCGFGDYSNFYRYFKREFGCSPREYFLRKDIF
ncbi:MAG: AraC family transcriptional regulator [Lachnospiraceae bacterium]|nr:AraC family transcriptional regulator [Lachnospiraceae bacterium]